MPKQYEIHKPEDRVIKIIVQSTRGKKQLAFSKLTKIGDVIDKAIDIFEFKKGDRFELMLATKPGEPLQPQETLASYQIEDDSVLILTSIGGGV
jgi:hypothetical protein